ncbi:MAG: DUF294 nucleotidyltransferase-like domain-containing protein [Gemmatimonadaceae bacterium]
MPPESSLQIPGSDKYDALNEAARFSQRTLEHLTASLRREMGSSDDVLTVAVAGSLGRMETTRLSDVDYIIVRKTGNTSGDAELMTLVNRAVEGCGLVAPRMSERLAAPVALDQLVEHMGSPAEAPDLLRKRMLLLLESRSVYAYSGFRDTVNRILERYALGVTATPVGTGMLEYLLADLIRYYRHIEVRADQRWPLRDVKLGHSRLIMYAGFLALLGEASKRVGDESTWLAEHLALTPIERIALVYEANRDVNLPELLVLYDMFLSRWADRAIRRQLLSVDELHRDEPILRELLLNADAIRTELVRFVLARQRDWSGRFFNHLFL